MFIIPSILLFCLLAGRVTLATDSGSAGFERDDGILAPHTDKSSGITRFAFEDSGDSGIRNSDDDFFINDRIIDPFTEPQRPRDEPDQETSNELKFNSSQEPLMLFSTGIAIKGYWMSNRQHFDVISKGVRAPKPSSSPSITQAMSVLFDLFNSEPRPHTGSPARASTDESVYRAKNTIVGIDMDPNDKEVFWVELGKEPGVYSTTIEDDQLESRYTRRQIEPDVRAIVDSGLLSPEDLALDTMGKNIYITDAGIPAIVVCSIKHSHCKIIVREELHKPRAIIADQATGWLTYTDWGDHPGIFVVSMDGKRRETLIDSDIVWPNGLAADYSSNHLYWADARLSKIERLDLTTKKRKEIIRESAANPFSLSLFEDRLYWSDWSGSDIRTCDKRSGNGTKTIMRVDNIYGIHIYHPNIYGSSIDQNNPCWSKHCSHMCLLSPASGDYSKRKPGALGATCVCPESMALGAADKSTCFEVQKTFLLVNVKNYIAQVYPAKIGLHIVQKVIYSPDHVIHDLATDWSHHRMFFFDASKRYIYQANLVPHDFKIEHFMPTSASVRGMLYDSWSDNLYWLDADKGTMSMAPVKSKFRLILRKDLDNAISMVLDSTNRVFYIAFLGNLPHIMRTDIFANESSDLTIVSTDIGLPVALHLDEAHQRLYFADARLETIESVDLDIHSVITGVKPNSRFIHRRKLGTVLAFAVYQENLVWTIKNGDYIYKAPMGDPNDSGPAKLLADEIRPSTYKLPSTPAHGEAMSDNMKVVLVDPKHEVINGPCQKRGCSHGCVLDGNHSPICICPEGQIVSNDTEGRTCRLANPMDCKGDSSRCNTGICKKQGTSWRCSCPVNTWGPFCEVTPTDSTGNQLTDEPSTEAFESEPVRESRNRLVWIIVLLVLLSVCGLVLLVSLFALYRQGRLPRNMSDLTVSFVQQARRDKDGAMLLLDGD